MQVVFLYVQKRLLHLPSVGYLHQLGDLASDARHLAPRARKCTQCNPRRAHNLVQIIVCYNYHSAELRVRGLPKMALWYICTFGHWYIGTFGYWYICISSFPLLSYKWGTHYRTNGGRCHRCNFPPLLRPLSYKWGMLP